MFLSHNPTKGIRYALKEPLDSLLPHSKAVRRLFLRLIYSDAGLYIPHRSTIQLWNICALEHWNICALEHLCIGTLEHWNIKTLEHLCIETLEHLCIETLEHWKICAIILEMHTAH